MFAMDSDKLRKSLDRHPNRGKGEEIGGVVSVSGFDNHKPRIIDCAKLNPSVKEEQSLGTFVTQIWAEDPNTGDEIEFTLVTSPSERNLFTIDSQNGRIYTNYVFDRDEPVRERQIYVTVRATDNGKPRLDDVCTIRIQIVDINDNAPILVTKTAIWYENQPPGDIIQIEAKDVDEPKNGPPFHFQLDPASPYFRKFFVSEHGVLRALETFDREEQKTYDIRILIADSGYPIMHNISKFELTIREKEEEIIGVVSVSDFDNHKPRITDCAKLNPSVKEEQSLGTFVTQIRAEDPNTGDEIEYTLVTSPSERNLFTIDSQNGRIYTNYVFDRDEPVREKQIYVTVRATDNGRPRLDDVCTIRIQIEDINDNAPVFDKIEYEEMIPKDCKVNSTVMRISASDFDDGDNSVVHYQILHERDHEFFTIETDNGIVYLKKSITKPGGKYYSIIVRAFNIIKEQLQEATTLVRFKVIESNRKPPYFINSPKEPLIIYENFKNFSIDLIKVRAESNVPNNSDLVFELLNGRTEQTNSKKTFVFNQEGNEAIIKLGTPLDYETITDYSLTMRVKNKYDLAAELLLKIKVKDVNDNIPYFVEVSSGTILENEPPRTPVLQVRALDMDGTFANNIVQYKLADHTDLFDIDWSTGNITSLVEFDREKKDFYNIKVIAYDSSPSSLYEDSISPNKAYQVFRIEIADKNDHPPKFQQKHYLVKKLAEDTNKNELVLEVIAEDVDTASMIQYEIVKGNVGNAFKIDSITGKIRVNESLDYEQKWEYNLKVRAFDGIFEAFTSITIHLENMNDNPPVFCGKFSVEVKEETVYDSDKQCILKIDAYDPDIKDRNVPQNIKFSIVDPGLKEIFAIDDKQCLRIKKGLDRDQPSGMKERQILIDAVDENGMGEKAVQEVLITLIDINDNAPSLVTKTAVWDENQPPGDIIQLEAKDVDEPKNGPPFHFQLDPASPYFSKFFVSEHGVLRALGTFDREEQKSYDIRILIADSGYPIMQNISVFKLIIGDVNDNEMKPGRSHISVNKMNISEEYEMELGRVYVDDPDDWDVYDKRYKWKYNEPPEGFKLHSETGAIFMSSTVKSTNYTLEFEVWERSRNVESVVLVTIKVIPVEAIDKSGSVRFSGISAEEFITTGLDGLSLKDKFHMTISDIFNAALENVDILTLRNVKDNYLDVRYSIHRTSYYHPEKLNSVLNFKKHALISSLGISPEQIYMIGVDECVIHISKKSVHCAYCDNVLVKKLQSPITIGTNQTTFVGVNAYDRAKCEQKCLERPNTKKCLNGGTAYDGECVCLEEFAGPNCEITPACFLGNGYGLFETVKYCDAMTISMSVKPISQNGLIFYSGPLTYHNPSLDKREYVALEIRDFIPVFTVQYRNGAVQIKGKDEMNQSEYNNILLKLDNTKVEMVVNNCYLPNCIITEESNSFSESIRQHNQPFQIGGIADMMDLEHFSRHYNWRYTPQYSNFEGCISNFSINGEYLDFGNPILENNYYKLYDIIPIALNNALFASNYPLIILLLICLILPIVIAIINISMKNEKKSDLLSDKDINEPCGNITQYEYEGGGEEDINTNQLYHLQQSNRFSYTWSPSEDVDQIGNFLAEQKYNLDRELFEDSPVGCKMNVDNVRLYAYEGEGASSCDSLSSLDVSDTLDDNQDLQFDYLYYFGPRFRKLYQLYEQPDGETEEEDDDTSFYQEITQNEREYTDV